MTINSCPKCGTRSKKKLRRFKGRTECTCGYAHEEIKILGKKYNQLVSY